MTRLRVGIVGLGIGRRHAREFQALPDRYEVTALCDADAGTLDKVADRLAVARRVSSFEALLALDLDVIDICTPPHLHAMMIEAALAAGKHVICEKPLVTSLAAVDHLLRLDDANDRYCMPISQYRFGAGIQKLRRLIDSGVTGKPYIASIETHWQRGDQYYAAPWRGRWATEHGGVVLGHALHNHDLLSYVMGDVASVYCRTDTRVNPIETEDCAALSMAMTNGALVTSSATLGSHQQHSRLRFCFERLTAESCLEPYDPGADPWTFTPADSAAEAAIDDALSAFAPTAPGFRGQFEAFHDSVTMGSELPVTLHDSRRALELVTAAYTSARENRTVTLPLGAGDTGYEDWRP